MGWNKNEWGGYMLDRWQLFIYGFVFPVLSSAINPVILIARGSKVREFMGDKRRSSSKVFREFLTKFSVI